MCPHKQGRGRERRGREREREREGERERGREGERERIPSRPRAQHRAGLRHQAHDREIMT